MRKRPYFSLADGALWAPSRGATTSGLIVIPPLIGDTALSQLHRFRALRREGFALYSFAFPGHPGARGRFSLQAAAESTCLQMTRAAGLARRMAAPLLGLGCCAATIPLLSATQVVKAPPERLVLLSPIVRFAPATILNAFWRSSREYSRNPFERLRSLPAYLEQLFPGIAKNRQRFGALRRRRIALPRLLAEILHDQPLTAVRIRHTPIVCCYGKADEILKQLMPKGAQAYEASIRRHCPEVIFHPLDSAHLLAGIRLRHHLRDIIAAAFKAH